MTKNNFVAEVTFNFPSLNPKIDAEMYLSVINISTKSLRNSVCRVDFIPTSLQIYTKKNCFVDIFNKLSKFFGNF